MNKADIPEIINTKPVPPSADFFMAKGAQVMGQVEIGKDASIWYNAVARGDINKVVIGARTNIQDNAILHVENDRACIIGEDVTVGHGAILHGCTISNGVLIGMGAIVLNGAVIKKGAVIGAGALIREHEIVPENTLWVGVPARQVKVLEGSYEQNIKWAAKYMEVAKAHQKEAE